MLNLTRMWTLPAVLGAALLAGTAVPQLKAGFDTNNMTTVTFSGPVEIGDTTLPAGTYVFKTPTGPDVNRIVEVMDATNTHLITIVNAVAAMSPVANGETQINLVEGPAGTPERVKDWLYPDKIQGWAFPAPKANR